MEFCAFCAWYIFCFQVIQLKSDGVAFRFMPDSSQVANAIKVTIFSNRWWHMWLAKNKLSAYCPYVPQILSFCCICNKQNDCTRRISSA